MSTIYEQYIAANQALLSCMEAVPADQYTAMSAVEQGNVCLSEASTVREHLQSGKISFGSIVQERLAIVKAQNLQ